MAFEAEIKELQKKLGQNPESLVFAPLADTLRKAGRLDEAVETCLKGLEHNPAYMTARVILGRTYAEKGQVDEAIAEFTKITLSDAGNIMAHSMLGQMHMRKGQYAEAIEEYQQVLALNPDDTGAQSMLQEALDKAREVPGQASSSAPVEAVEASAPEEKLATITVAEIYIKKGAFEEAVEVFNEILQSDPGNKVAKAKLAEIIELKDKRAKEEAEVAAKAQRESEEEKNKQDAVKAKAEAEEKQRQEEEAKAKAEAEEKRRQEEEAKAKAEAEEKRRQEEETARGKQEAERQRKEKEEDESAEKITADDIFSVMKMTSPDEVIDEENTGKEKQLQAAKASAPSPASLEKPKPSVEGAQAAAGMIRDFVKANGLQGSLLVSKDGEVIDGQLPGGFEAKTMGHLASAIFSNTEKAINRMRYGSLNQVIIAGEDGRQILFVQLKQGIMAAVTQKNVNLGLLRIALHDLVKRASA